MFKLIPYLFFLIIIFGCNADNPTPKVVISSEKIEKKVIFEDTFPGSVTKIQLTDFHPSKGPEISILGQTGIWFLSPRDYKHIETYHFKNANGKSIWFGNNPQLLDIYNDGKFQIMMGGGGYSDLGLLDSKGNKLWNFRDHPKLSPRKMISGDLDNDNIIEFYVAGRRGLYRLSDKGKVIWKVNQEPIPQSFFYDIEILTNKESSKHYLIALAGYGNYQIFDYNGNKIRQFSIDHKLTGFEIVEWKENIFILAGGGRKVSLIDLYGKIVHEFELGHSLKFHWPQGLAVRFSPNSNEYLIILTHSKSALGLTKLSIISPDCKIIYQEIINNADGFIKLYSPGTKKEVLIIGDGDKRVLEYSLLDN